MARKPEDPQAKAIKIAEAAVENAEGELGSTHPEIPEQPVLKIFIWQSRLTELIEEGE